MACTNQTACNSTGGKAPREELAKKAVRKAAPDADENSRRGFREGMVALQKIRKRQKSPELLICKSPLNRFMREVAQERMQYVRFTSGAVEALQHTTEVFIVERFEEAQLAAIYAKRFTVIDTDLHLAVRMRGWVLNILQ